MNNTFAIPPQLAEALRSAQHVAVLTGAGVSAESGIPTFRDALTGLWAQYDPHELATPQAFQRDPRLVWEWNMWRRNLIAHAMPNAGHYALAALAQHAPRLTLITQNIDGLHQRAGSANVLELHGNITRTKCSKEHVLVDAWPATDAVPPHCPRCGGLLRPDVVWFGEALPEPALEAAFAAAETCDMFLLVGTSGEVEPAAALPRVAMRHGTTLVVINPAITLFVSTAYYGLSGPSGVILPALVQAAWPNASIASSPT